jgi:8'-apo-carotenoid 13,14-cleaving dioxygenase
MDMTSAVETAIRGTITRGANKVAQFNRARARNTQGEHPYLTGMHTPMAEEITLTDLVVEGTIPESLNGRYCRIGPNPAGAPNPARYHWFAGDGMVHGVRIEGGRALWYRNRWVRSSSVSALLGEARKPGPRLHDEFPVNTNIVGHGGKFWALVEAGGTPVELDGELETVAHNDFGGTLKGAFSAHPHRDPDSVELHAICYHSVDMTHVYHVVVGADGRVRREEPIAVHHGPSIHDCAITARFVLVFDLPVTFSMAATMAGYSFPYRWNPDHPARIGLLPREGSGGEVIWCAVDPCYVYHTANAYDLPDGRVVVDVSAHNRNGYRDFRGPDAEDVKFERWTIDPASRSVTRVVLDDSPQEFLRFDERLTGKPYRYAYAVSIPAGIEDGLIGSTSILKHDVTTGTRLVHDFGPDHYPGEFVFVPRDAAAGEDDGWLIGLVVDMADESTDLMILDAREFEAEPQARIRLPHRVPPGFHGNWISEV